MGEAADRGPKGDFSSLAFAVVSGSPSAEDDLAELCGELERALSRPVAPKVLANYAALKDEMEAGRAQIIWAPPLVAVELEGAGLASIDLLCSRGGRVDYHTAIFVRHASTIEKFADLQGCHAAWVDADSAAGYLVPRTKIAGEGFDPEKLFGKQSFLGTHARVAHAVLEGEADVGATYLSLDPRTGRPVSAGWLEAGAGINGAFILATAGPIPSDAIALARSMPADLKASIVERIGALAESSAEAVGRLLRAEGFAPPPEGHFDGLRALLANRASA